MNFRYWRIAASYTLFPNVPFWILHRQIAIADLGWFNLEYLLVGLVALVTPLWFSLTLLTVAVLVDFTHAVAVTYFFTWSDVIRSLRFIRDWPVERITIWIAVLTIGLLILCFLIGYRSPRLKTGERLKPAILLLGIAILLISIDAFTGHNALIKRSDSFLTVPRLARSPSVTLLRVLAVFRYYENYTPDTLPIHSAMYEVLPLIMSPLTGRSQPNIVLVIAESWGLTTDSAITGSINQLYDTVPLRGKYNVLFGEADFEGGTVAAELRELCQSRLGLAVFSANPEDLQNCLPQVLNGKGFETAAVHGYSGAMFDRQDWYTAIGFQKRWFLPELEKEQLGICPGVFPGICDRDIARWIGKRLVASTKPTFFYWVTLNSHLPVPSKLPAGYHANCEISRLTADNNAACSWYKLVYRVHRSVAELADMPDIHNTVFLVIGDHCPPFGSQKIRRSFSNEKVPYALLLPKELKENSPPRFKATVKRVGAGRDL